jgi:rhamnulokinase
MEPHVDEGAHHQALGGGVGGTIRFLKNIMGLWLVQECRRQWVKEGHDQGMDVVITDAPDIILAALG